MQRLVSWPLQENKKDKNKRKSASNLFLSTVNAQRDEEEEIEAEVIGAAVLVPQSRPKLHQRHQERLSIEY